MNKKTLTALLSVAVICIVIGLLIFILGNPKEEKEKDSGTSSPNPSPSAETVVAPKPLVLSKRLDYEGILYGQILSKENSDEIIASKYLDLTNFFDDEYYQEKYNSCNGSISFSPTNKFSKWEFNTSCNDSENDRTLQLISTSNETEILTFQKVKNGFVVLTTIPDFMPNKYSDVGILFFDSNWNFQWEDHLKDQPTSTIRGYDIIESGNDFYVLGSATDVTGGSFAEILNGRNSFTYLAKYSQSGTRLAFINIDSLSNQPLSDFGQILKLEGNTLYLSGLKQIAVLENENSLKAYNIEDPDISVTTINQKNEYFGYSDEEQKTEEGPSYFIGHVQNISDEGKVNWDIAISKFTTCGMGKDCGIQDVQAIGDYVAVQIPNRIIILDRTGKFMKTIDYSSMKVEDSEDNEGSGNIAGIVAGTDSYSILSFPDYTHLYIETYSYNNNKSLSKKMYESQGLVNVYGYSNEAIWEMDGEHITLYAIGNSPLATAITVPFL